MSIKNLIVVLFVPLVQSQRVSAQEVLDTLYANSTENVALFFPNPIHKGVTGHQGFVFTYDRERPENLGLLQGIEGPGSNLLVMTKDGTVYSFILAYSKKLYRHNYFVPNGKSIGVVGNLPSRTKTKDKTNEQSALEQLSHNFSAHLLDEVPKNLATKRKNRLRLALEDMVYEGDAVYLVIEIRNRSGIDFEVGRLEFSRVRGSEKRRVAYQEIGLAPISYLYFPKVIPTGKKHRFVAVFPKFVLSDNEHLKIVVLEEQGNRRMMLVH